MKIKTLAVLVATATTVSGCGMFGDDGMFRNRSGDYRHAVEMPPLVVPEDMDTESIGQLYPVPQIPETAVTEDFDTVPRPQPLAANSIDEVIRIQTLGDERWILSNRDPSEIWPRVRNILNRSGIPTARAEASQGVLETVWLEFKGDEEQNHRYRFYIQPGVQMQSTEIKVLHDQMNKDGAEKASWPEASVDDGREKDMVEILANALAGDVTSGTVSLLAQAIGGEQKVEFVTPRVADPYLLMRLDEERAWASLAYSLTRGGFTTVDQDRSAGTFYVNYTPPEDDKEPGFFRRMFSRDGKVVEANYQIRLSEAEEGSQIRVLDVDGNGLERNEAIRLLRSVRANLS
ncbi:MAG: outer membrane protein assembly factor BamC [Porticoccaceae bacterium]